MPAQPCANHPKEMTFVRCGRCDKPICVQCMVNSPVGKKCRDCARNRTHLVKSSPRQVILAFVAATAVAIPTGFVVVYSHMFWILPFFYGALVGEVALRAGQRRRSLAMQVSAGLAALIGTALAAAVMFLSLPRCQRRRGYPSTISGSQLWSIRLLRRLLVLPSRFRASAISSPRWEEMILMALQVQELLALQALDTEMGKLIAERDALDRGERVERALAVRQNRLGAAERRLHNLEIVQRTAELELKSLEEKKHNVSQKLYTGKITAPRELQAMEAEIGMLDRQRQKLDD